MSQDSIRCFLGMRVGSAFGYVVSLTLAFSGNCAVAQITPDKTLPNNSLVTVNGNTFNITGGTQAGRNLFHSFKEFSVPTGGTAFFNNVVDIKNIISRVTGLSVSNIDGILRANGTANLFLINPNGMIFGPNAALNVGGSFVGTTANAIQFGNRGNFSASTPNAPSPLLTINPSALLFNQLSPASITNNSIAPAGINPAGVEVTGLRVPDGQSLLLVGGNINIDGGSLRAYEGRIELAGLSAPGTVGLNVADNILSLSVPDSVARADMFLTNGAEVNVRGEDGGSIAINARNVNLAGASKLRAGIDSGLGTPNSKAGDIVINATGSTTLSDSSFMANVVQSLAVGTGGNIKITTGSLSLSNGAALSTNLLGQGDGGSINITAGSVSLTDGAFLNANTNGQGNGGSIFMQASGGVSLANSVVIYSNVNAGAVGNSGDILITAGSLSLTNGAQLQSGIIRADASNPGGIGNAGGVYINVGSRLTLAGVNQNGNPSAIYTDVGAGAIGNGGDININAGSVSLTDGALLIADTHGLGNGGNIIINARERVDFDAKGDTFSAAKSNVQSGAVGKSGDIQIKTGSLFLSNGAFLSSSTLGNGDAGNITIDARDQVNFSGGSSAISDVHDSGVGKGGDIRVTTGTLSLTNGARIVSNVSGQGNAGNITIDARDTVTFDGIVGYAISGVQSSILTGGVGKGGDIRLTTGSLSVTGGAELSTSSDGRGNAGNISINARDTITFEGGGSDKNLPSEASSFLGSNGVGNGGNILVNARALFLKNGGELDASNFGIGNAGSITINASDTVAFDGAGSDGLPSSAVSILGGKGKGGDIFVTTGSLSITNGAQLNSNTAGQGNGGNITITARDAITLNGTGSNGSLSGLLSGVASSGVGKGGDIQVTTGSLTVSNGALLVSTTTGLGNAGNITINARDSVRFDGVGSNQQSSGAYSTVDSTGVGNAGNINVKTGSLSLNNGAQISAGTYGSGTAGDITINARDAITLNGTGSNGGLSGVFSRVGTGSTGIGGNIQVKSGTLSLSNSAQLGASTFGRGDAGNIWVQVDDAVKLTNSSQIRTSVESGGFGIAGDIDILARSLLVTDGAQIQSVLFRPIGNLPAAQGRGGNIRVTTTDSVTLSGIGSTGFSSGLFTGTDRKTTGNAGNITVTTGNFRVSDAATVDAGTSGFGDGGNITINANTFQALNGGQVLTNTSGSGKAGTITVKVKDSLTLAGSDPNFTQRQAQVEQRLRQPGQTDQLSDVITNQGATSGIFANTTVGSTGVGGSIFIDPRQATIRDGAKISVNSDGTGNAGNITLLAGTLTLDNQGSISAQTASSTGGNINLQLDKALLLRHGSQISTTAGTAQAGGDGGNITIHAPFIVAVPSENNHIAANAFSGNGGKVDITTKGIYGIQFQSTPTPESDITASSTLGVTGQVIISQPDVQPTQELSELPAQQFQDISNQIGQVCPKGIAARRQSEFIITGRGSLPPSPLEPLAISSNLIPLATLESDDQTSLSNKHHSTKLSNFSTPIIPTKIVEATGWIKNADGSIELVAQVPSSVPHAIGSPLASCLKP